MILDRIENWKIHAGQHPGLARGLELLASGKLDALVPGRHDLDGDALFASVQEYEPKPALECRWEAHRKYIDIQYLVAGAEGMGCCAVDQLRVAEAYDPDRDVAFYAGGPEAGAVLKVGEKMFAVFFPDDAHMPGLRPEAGSGTVKKIVLKVACSRN